MSITLHYANSIAVAVTGKNILLLHKLQRASLIKLRKRMSVTALI